MFNPKTTILSAATLLFIISTSAHAKNGPGRYHNEAYGLSMEIPKFKASKSPSVTIVHFFAPAADNFAPNINVQIQHIKMTLDGYIKLSKEQFKKMGLKVSRIKKVKMSGLPAVELEYAGPMHNRKLSFVAVAVARNDHFVLLTGTALQSQIGKYRKVMWNAIRSVSLNKSVK